VSTYRTGSDDGYPAVIRNDAELVAVVVNGDQALAERIALMLNEGPIADDAIELLRYALHLRQHGERAPGGNETWRAFDRRAEAFLRAADGQAAQ
jgi:hypothetical protein